MKAVAMDEISKLAGAALAAGLVFAAAPAAAQVLKLDCEVEVETRLMSTGEHDTSSGSSRGVWKVLVEQDGGVAEVRFDEASPYGISRGSGLDLDYLEHYDDSPAINEDRIAWCPIDGECGVQLPLRGTGGGWYRVSEAVIDRRRGTLVVTVEEYIDMFNEGGTNIYRGRCAPEPEPMF